MGADYCSHPFFAQITASIVGELYLKGGLKMNKDLAIRTINRCNEVGVFDMKCLKHEYETTGDMIRHAVDILIERETDDIPGWVKKYVLMDDEQFERQKWMAKLAVKKFDIDHTKSDYMFKLF